MNAVEETLYHTHMIISKEDGTLVLATGEELQEILSDKVRIVTSLSLQVFICIYPIQQIYQGPTINVASICNNQKVAQVRNTSNMEGNPFDEDIV